jgi:hypothetical protein
MRDTFAGLGVSSVVPAHFENGMRKIFDYAENILEKQGVEYKLQREY